MARAFILNCLTTLGVLCIRMMGGVAFLFQRNRNDRFARAVGRFVAKLSTGQTRTLKENFSLMLGMKEPQLSSMVTTVFENFCVTLYDFFHAEGVVVDVPERDKLERLREQHKGILILTFHMGHWELGARVMQSWGWPVTAVYQEYKNRSFRRLIQKHRAPGVNYIPVGAKAAQRVLQAFRQGDIVAMLGDHPFGEAGVPVDLCGKKVLWPKGPVVLAVRENIPIVVALVVRVGHRTYRAFIEEPLIPQNHSRAEVQRLVQAVATKFAKFMHAYPEQWYRFRKFEEG